MSTATARPSLSLLGSARALGYREWRTWVNHKRTMVAGRWRLAIYLPVAAFTVLGIVGRFLHRSAGHPLFTVPPDIVRAVVVMAPGLAFLSIGTLILASLRNGPPLFVPESPDAYLIAGSRMSPRAVVLILLATRSKVVRLAVYSLLALLLLPSTAGIPGLNGVGWVLGLRLVALLPAAWSLPVFVVSRRTTRVSMRLVGRGVVAFGALALSFEVLSALRSGGADVETVVSVFAVIPPGSFAGMAAAGNLAGCAGLAALVAAGGAVSWWAARDCYPELFMATSQRLALAARRAGVVAEKLREGVVTSSTGERVPAREWALLWRWWVHERRTRGRTRFLRFGIAAAAGLAIGIVLRLGPAWLGTWATVLFCLGASSENGSSTIMLPMDVRILLWHLVDAPLARRLRVVAFTNTLSNWMPWSAGLIAAAIPRPWLLPASILGAVDLLGYVWLRQTLGLVWFWGTPDFNTMSTVRRLLVSMSIAGLIAATVFYIQWSNGPVMATVLLLLPLPILLPLGWLLTSLAARLLSGNERNVILAGAR